MEIVNEKSTRNLLWTGGWDSTYRLLDLVLRNNIVVQPFYLIDSTRKSTRIELLTMRKIKDYLFEKYPHTKNLILKTVYEDTGDISPDDQISHAYAIIREKHYLGSQFPWLARFCKEHKITNMELCAGLTPGGGSSLIFEPFIEQVQIDSDFVYKIKEECFDTPEGIIFKDFVFPLFGNYDKQRINKVSDENGWTEIMTMTWFCHTPILGKISCGVCSPCEYVYQGNMEWRMPWYINTLKKMGVLRLLKRMHHTMKKASHTRLGS